MSREAAGGGGSAGETSVGISRDVRFDGMSGKKSGCAKSELDGREMLRETRKRGGGGERERAHEREQRIETENAFSRSDGPG